MVIVEGKKEENLIAGYPVRETFFKDGEILTFDKDKKQWIAQNGHTGELELLDGDGLTIHTLTIKNGIIISIA